MRRVVIPKAAVPAVLAAAFAFAAAGCSPASTSVSGGVLGAETSAPSPSGAASDTPAPATPASTAELTTTVPPPSPTAQPPTRAATPAPTPHPVVVVTSQDYATYAYRLGTILVLRFGGSPSYAWQTPTDSNPGVLAPQSVTTTRGSLDASYLANRTGTSRLGLVRIAPCPPPSPGAKSGLCGGAVAFTITVNVVP